MNYHNGMQDLVKILTNIKNYLDDFDSSKLSQECKNLEVCMDKYSISAMIVYRLRKISQSTKYALFDNITYLRREIDELIQILTNFVSWQCKMCKKIIAAEHKDQLTLWITAHEISDNCK